MRALRGLGLLALFLGFVQVVFGAIVRITGSGMGCGDHWPDCYGSFTPAHNGPNLLVEISHRYGAAALSLAIGALAVTAWLKRREPGVGGPGGVLRASLLAIVLVVAAALFGAVTVKLSLHPLVVVTHLAIAMALLGVLVVVVVRAGGLGGLAIEGRSERTLRAARVAVVLAFLALVLGALTANTPGAPGACQGFPWCRVIGESGTPLLIQGTHRVIAFLLLAHLIGVAIGVRKRAQAKPIRAAAWTALGIVVLQVVVAAAMVEMHLPASLRSIHQAIGTALWISVVTLAALSSRRRFITDIETIVYESPSRGQYATPEGVSTEMQVMVQDQAQPSLLRDLVMLTKPRIISLLLVTTIAPMFVAGNPGWLLCVIVLIGGYMMAGGANAVNMYLDSDIDTRMSRTRLRPIPSGRMGPRAVLAFGVALATAATFLLARFTNVLTAVLALAGFYFYVFIYTRWLKRTTPQNIVIGGAAGAFPPLVGWAAMTGTIDLTAVYLFLIVFYWTPPHFWALALLKQRDYGRAGVPMAPLVWGERETMRQMMWYNVILIALTLLPVTFGAFGIIYLVSALALGAILLVGVIRVGTSADWTQPAWWVYKFSLLYLALLFVAMVIDRKVLG